MKLTFVGANPATHAEPFDSQDTRVSYLLGSDPQHWHRDVPVWGGVRYPDLYPGIDLEVVGTAGTWQPRLVVHDPKSLAAVRLRIEGGTTLHLAGGHLVVGSTVGDVTLPLLPVFAPDGVTPFSITTTPLIQGNDVTTPFANPGEAAPDTGSATLGSGTASPSTLMYSTYLGGSSHDCDYDCAIAVDSHGAIYLTGQTVSDDFPTTPGSFDPRTKPGLSSSDAYVTKMDPRLGPHQLVYSTYLGGTNDDLGKAIAVDQFGAAYVVGGTSSPDFPTTPGAYDLTCGTDGRCNPGGYLGLPTFDAFVTKLDPTGSDLEYSTFVGGNGYDIALGVAVDAAGAVYITGYSSVGLGESVNAFPTTPGAFDVSYNGGYDGFVTKIDPTGSHLDYSTFLGGSTYDIPQGIAIDRRGAAYVTGWTDSVDFPTTSGAYDTTFGTRGGCCGSDAFVTKFDPSGSRLLYSTYLGGGGTDAGQGIAVDPSGAAYVTGWTQSTNFPTTLGAYDRNCDTSGYGCDNVFVTKLNRAGSQLVYSTFIGGSENYGNALAVDESGEATIVGYTVSADYPTTPGAFARNYKGLWDAFVTRLNRTGSGLLYSTFLGGTNTDIANSVALGPDDQVYVTGSTLSNDFPTTASAFDPKLSGGYDSFVSVFALPRHDR